VEMRAGQTGILRRWAESERECRDGGGNEAGVAELAAPARSAVRGRADCDCDARRHYASGAAVNGRVWVEQRYAEIGQA